MGKIGWPEYNISKLLYLEMQSCKIETFIARSKHCEILKHLLTFTNPRFLMSDKKATVVFQLVKKNGVHLSYSTTISFVKYVTWNRVGRKIARHMRKLREGNKTENISVHSARKNDIFNFPNFYYILSNTLGQKPTF